MTSIDDSFVKDLQFPFTFKAQSKEGEVEVVIDKMTESYAALSGIDSSKPYYFSCAKIEFELGIEGSCTIKDIKKQIAEYNPMRYSEF